VQRTIAARRQVSGRHRERDRDQLLTAERDALRRFQDRLPLQASIRDAGREFVQARERTLETWKVYRTRKAELEDYEGANTLAIWVPGSEAWQRSAAMRRDVQRAASEYAVAARRSRAQDRWKSACRESWSDRADQIARKAPLAPR
jgi:hypothetical protein